MLRDLTVNLGVRYELQTFTDSRKSFAPRACFAYNVGGDGKTVIYRKEIQQIPEVDYVIGTNELERVLVACADEAAAIQPRAHRPSRICTMNSPRACSPPQVIPPI